MFAPILYILTWFSNKCNIRKLKNVFINLQLWLMLENFQQFELVLYWNLFEICFFHILQKSKTNKIAFFKWLFKHSGDREFLILLIGHITKVHAKKVTDFGYPRGCWFRKHQIKKLVPKACSFKFFNEHGHPFLNSFANNFDAQTQKRYESEHKSWQFLGLGVKVICKAVYVRTFYRLHLLLLWI
jgi:hypothetical protein